MLFIKQAVLCLISPLHLPRRFATWWILKNHILKRVGEIYKRTSMKDLLKIRIKALLLIAIFLLSVVGGLSAKKIAIIDAGSSGSRLYVYDIDDNTKVLTTLYPIGDKVDASKGVALSCINNCQKCVDSFLTTMTCKYSNPDKFNPIDLYVLATAGMRLVNSIEANSIYTKMKNTSLSGYKLEKAMTISGRYEGIYAWIAANYKNGELKWDSGKKSWSFANPNGILEIGGASMQIAYKVSSVQSEDCIRHNKFGVIYSKSYLGGGADQVFEKNESVKQTDFGVGLDDIKSMIIASKVTFVGLGTPLRVASEGAKGLSCEDLNHYATTINARDTKENHHPKMNVEYIVNVFEKWGLDGKIDLAKDESDWTVGVALDIVVNDNKNPEAFNYSTKKPN